MLQPLYNVAEGLKTVFLTGFSLLCAPAALAMNWHEIEAGELPRDSELAQLVTELGGCGRDCWSKGLLKAEKAANDALRFINARYVLCDGKLGRLRVPSWDEEQILAYKRVCRCFRGHAWPAL